MRSFLLELRRRKVYRVALVYSGVAWLVLQLADVVSEPLGLPAWTINLLLVCAAAGFPLALILSWVFEMTPAGLQREKELERGPRGNLTAVHMLELSLILVLAGLVGYLYFDRLSVERDSAGQPPSLAVTEPAKTAGSTDQTAPAPARRSIAVLPFVDMSPDGDQEWFGDGLAEELLNRLVQLPGLQVAARTSAFSFKGKNATVTEIGSILGVATVLEGSVRKAGNRLRITAQLIDASDNYHLWSQTYDRTLDDIFAIQDELTREIASQLQVKLGLADTPLQGGGTDNVEAYQHYLRAQAKIASALDEADVRQVLRELEQAFTLDPGFANAYAAAAVSLWAIHNLGFPLGEDIERMRQLSERAVALAPDNLLAQMTYAQYRATWQGDLEPLARIDERLSRERLPWGWSWQSADLSLIEGRWQAGYERLLAAQKDDPLNPFFFTRLGQFARAMGKNTAALSWLQDGLDLAPDSPTLLPEAVVSAIDLGQLDTAEALAERAGRAHGEGFVWNPEMRARLATARGDTALGRKLLAQWVDMLPVGLGAEVFAAEVAYLLGDTDQALALLERAVSGVGVYRLFAPPGYGPLPRIPRPAALPATAAATGRGRRLRGGAPRGAVASRADAAALSTRRRTLFSGSRAAL